MLVDYYLDHEAGSCIQRVENPEVPLPPGSIYLRMEIPDGLLERFDVAKNSINMCEAEFSFLVEKEKLRLGIDTIIRFYENLPKKMPF